MYFDKVLYKFVEPHGQGDVYIGWQKGEKGSLLATTGSDGTIAIYNKQGQLVERVVLTGLCSGFSWNNNGRFLGIIVATSPIIVLWDSEKLTKTTIETGLRDALSCIVWSKQEDLIAVGTVKGNLCIYNCANNKRTPVLGKHNKRITCGVWSAQNLLVLGADDKSFSLSNSEGDTIKVVQLRDSPIDICFSSMGASPQNSENAISMIIGKRTLFIYNILETDSPIELGFQSRYGSLLQHKWFGDGYILLGFSSGYVVAISTHLRDIGQELWQIKNHKDNLTALAHCPALDIVASCGDDNIKIHSISNLQDTEKIITLPDLSGVQMIDWSSNGQLLGVTTDKGDVYIYVTQLQTKYSVSGLRIAMLSNLTEVSIYVYSVEKSKPIPLRQRIEIEPDFLAIGPFHLAVGVKNQIWFYYLGQSLNGQPELLCERKMESNITKVCLNAEYCAILCEAQLVLQAIDVDGFQDREKILQSFPDNAPSLGDVHITCFSLTSDFLIFGTDLGHIVYFSLEKWDICLTYRHMLGLQDLFPDSEGTKLIFTDLNRQSYILFPALEEAILIAECGVNCLGFLWDLAASNIFISFNEKSAYTHYVARNSVNGKHTVTLKETKLAQLHLPIMLCDGEIVCYVDGGLYSTQTLSTHLNSASVSLNEMLSNLLALRKYNEAYKICEKLNVNTAWLEFAEHALQDLEPDLALKAYKNLNNPGIVAALEEVRFFEDINLLTGFCCILLKKYDECKEFFLKSSYSKEALEICRDLLQWEQALLLAHKFEPAQVPFLACEYAQQLEFSGNYIDALYHYEKGFKEDLFNDENNYESMNFSPEYEEHIRVCKMGIARTSIRAGDFRRGVQYAIMLNDKQLYYDCAELLAAVGHLTEAASLYEKGQFYDEACSQYISLKMWNKASAILPNVQSTKLHAAYAKAKEADGQFKDAINSYRLAGDVNSCIRIYLDHLFDPHAASELVMETKTVEGAKMLSKFYQKIGDIDQALHYLIMCGSIEEAFLLAHSHKKLEKHGELLEKNDNAKPSDFLALAQHFEKQKYTILAGKFYFLACEFTKAMRFLLKASAFSNDESEALSLAIDCASASNNDQLANQLIEFLLGEVDGSPKDPRYLFRLYMSRKQYKEAAKTAIIIANQEQISGNYKSARDLLFSMYQELKRNNLSVTAEMRQNIILLHRYALVRIHVRLGNHSLAAKLLIQVASNLSQFSDHMVAILTSTVIECHRAGFKKHAFTYASTLMRPEYRNQLDGRYAKKVESIVRKAPRGIKSIRDEIEDEAMECPICDTPLPIMDVTCYSCKTTLPICIATGQHIIKENMTSCPKCDFLCFRAEMEKILSELEECPMCGENVTPEQLLHVEDIRPYILAA